MRLWRAFCAWRARIWARRVERAAARGDWTTVRAYAHRQADWELKAGLLGKKPAP